MKKVFSSTRIFQNEPQIDSINNKSNSERKVGITGNMEKSRGIKDGKILRRTECKMSGGS